MRRLLPALLVFTLSSIAQTAWAQATRTWISGVGDDVNPCSRTAPCKTFAGAISKTAARGEIDALDPGGWGAVTITKAITLDGGPHAGGILNASTNGINIAASGAVDHVVLRNLVIQSAGIGLVGVLITSAASVTLENVTIIGHLRSAVEIQSAMPTRLIMRDVRLFNNARDPETVYPNIGLLSETIATLTRVFSSNTPVGLSAQANSRVSINDSVFFAHGIALRASDGAAINVDRSMISGGVTAIENDGTVRISGVMTSHNTTAFAGANNVDSFGNNPVADTVGLVPNALPLR